MNNTDKTIEQVYRCHGLDAQGRECGQLHPESSIAVRPGTRVLYCDQCQSEDVRLCTESEEALTAYHGLTGE